MDVQRARSRTRARTYLPAGDRRAQILTVARGVFARRGYHGANVADICEAAQIARGTLYQYFDNKRDVLLAVLDDLAARVKNVIRTRQKVSDVVARLPVKNLPVEMTVEFCALHLRAFLDAVFEDEATLRLVVREGRGLGGGLDRAIARVDALVLGAVEEDLRAGQRAGLLRVLDPRRTALFILGGVEKLVLDALASAERVDLDSIVKLAVELELFGLLPEEARK